MMSTKYFFLFKEVFKNEFAKKNPEFKRQSMKWKCNNSPVKKKFQALVTVFFDMNRPGVTMFIDPSARAGYDTRSNFKQSLTGLNSEFSFT